MSAENLAASGRLAVIAPARGAAAADFARDVGKGLSALPKTLPPKYFYDALGSALFDAITLLPEYYLTRVETQILHEHGAEIVRALGRPVAFIELGSGSAAKTRILIEQALRAQDSLHYSPVDISADTLSESAQALVADYPALRVTAYADDYFTVLRAASLQRVEHVLVMFMGSNIGNYEPAQAREIVRAIAAMLKPGDGLLVGIDLKKDAQVLERAYDDSLGVTAAFDKNLLARINRELGGDFDLHDFRLVVQYDVQDGCVRSYLEAQRALRVRIEAIELDVTFSKGERLHTESSYKYSAEEIALLARDCGLNPARLWMDGDRRFSVNLFVKERS